MRLRRVLWRTTAVALTFTACLNSLTDWQRHQGHSVNVNASCRARLTRRVNDDVTSVLTSLTISLVNAVYDVMLLRLHTDDELTIPLQNLTVVSVSRSASIHSGRAARLHAADRRWTSVQLLLGVVFFISKITWTCWTFLKLLTCFTSPPHGKWHYRLLRLNYRVCMPCFIFAIKLTGYTLWWKIALKN